MSSIGLHKKLRDYDAICHSDYGFVVLREEEYEEIYVE
jgi:hypothetical protein